MNPTVFIHMLGSLSIFPSRAFMPAFFTSLLLRFGPDIPAIKDTILMKMVGTPPEWFVHPITIAVLGLLSLGELIGQKDADVRQMMDQFDGYVKSAMAAITSLALLSGTDAELLRSINEAGMDDLFWVGGVAAGVFFLSMLRKQVLGFIREADQDDDLGIQTVISWVEDLWAIFGLFLLVLYPLFILAAAALLAGGLLFVRKYMAYREEQAKIPCRRCGEPIYGCATACAHCGGSVDEPMAIGLFGQTTSVPTKDLAGQPYHLTEMMRCPACASRFKKRNPKQKCEVCGYLLMAFSEFSDRYIARISARLPKVLGMVFLLGLIPVLGVIPGLIYYRINLVAPFRRYLSPMTGFLLKWMVRVLIMVLILIQVIPGVGALALVLMAGLEHFAYRRVYQSQLGDSSEAAVLKDKATA